MTLGETLKTIRTAKNLTLRQVEKLSNDNGLMLSNSYLSQLESGKITRPSIKVIQTVCRVYGITMTELFEGTKAEQETHWTELNIYLSLMTDAEKEQLTNFAVFILQQRKS